MRLDLIYLLQGISTTHLTPFEVLTAINHAQLQLNRTFSNEEIKSGVLADLMIDEDFNFEETVSLLLYRLESVMYQMSLNNEPEFVPSSYHISFHSYNIYLFQSKNLAAD